VRSADDPALLTALQGASLAVSHADDGALLVDARADAVGDVALAAGVALRELGSTQASGLEQLFFSLTEHGTGEGAPVASPPLPVPPMPLEEVRS
jgi:ABC-2 type transport system ATP-binding protein